MDMKAEKDKCMLVFKALHVILKLQTKNSNKLVFINKIVKLIKIVYIFL